MTIAETNLLCACIGMLHTLACDENPIWKNIIRVGDRMYTEILVLPLEEANELLASRNDQFELIVIKVVAIKVIGHQFFAVLGKKESRPVQVPTPVQASREQVR